MLNEFKEDIGITDIEMEALLKANSKTWGLGGHGKTCGTVQGPIHFIGYVYGEDGTRDPFNEAATLRMLQRVNAITEFVDRIQKERGSTDCKDYHYMLFDQYFDLNTPEGFVGYNNADGVNKCAALAENSIRTILDIILNDDGTLKEF